MATRCDTSCATSTRSALGLRSETGAGDLQVALAPVGVAVAHLHQPLVGLGQRLYRQQLGERAAGQLGGRQADQAREGAIGGHDLAGAIDQSDAGRRRLEDLVACAAAAASSLRAGCAEPARAARSPPPVRRARGACARGRPPRCSAAPGWRGRPSGAGQPDARASSSATRSGNRRRRCCRAAADLPDGSAGGCRRRTGRCQKPARTPPRGWSRGSRSPPSKSRRPSLSAR